MIISTDDSWISDRPMRFSVFLTIEKETSKF